MEPSSLPPSPGSESPSAEPSTPEAGSPNEIERRKVASPVPATLGSPAPGSPRSATSILSTQSVPYVPSTMLVGSSTPVSQMTTPSGTPSSSMLSPSSAVEYVMPIPSLSSSVLPSPASSADIPSLILDLLAESKREAALLELSKRRETLSEDLAPLLWYTPGVMVSVLQEIITIYPLLTPPKLKAHASNRVCNALALFQCVASHPDTRPPFVASHLPLYLYPFLNTTSKTRPFEYLRLTSLGVIGALVKVDDPQVVTFLLSTELVPLTLRIMESGSELSRTVSTFILQKALQDERGLEYVCHTYERFNAVASVLNGMVVHMAERPSARLLKHIIRCYLRLSDNPKAREALKTSLPESFTDGTMATFLKHDGDHAVKRWFAHLISNLGDTHQSPHLYAQTQGTAYTGAQPKSSSPPPYALAQEMYYV
eukprot:TRINITY_DN5569_c0_g1_i6.p3 TRINITY_DN5569_c0_g1~~TRINITY_DN5569_c0_g1_i6.p3  ORF type:complete len:427 (+),score=88.05 TRINITY_DN5569_c0_g1_i6:3688-4968(+)